MAKNTIEVCLTPAEFDNRITAGKPIVVINDILRAATSIITAFHYGVEKIIPIADIEEAREFKNRGMLVAAERNGIKLDFADFGNSPFEFMTEKINGKTIIYSSTNGTQAIEKAKTTGEVVLGAFINLKALADWILPQNKNVIIYCSGWKNSTSLEDTLFAGALTEYLTEVQNYDTPFDSTQIALELWKLAKHDLRNFIKKAVHFKRLQKLNAINIMDYALTLNTTDVIPVLENNYLINDKLFS